jgi:hypothetical protein
MGVIGNEDRRRRRRRRRRRTFICTKALKRAIDKASIYIHKKK